MYHKFAKFISRRKAGLKLCWTNRKPRNIPASRSNNFAPLERHFQLCNREKGHAGRIRRGPPAAWKKFHIFGLFHYEKSLTFHPAALPTYYRVHAKRDTTVMEQLQMKQSLSLRRHSKIVAMQSSIARYSRAGVSNSKINAFPSPFSSFVNLPHSL